MNMMTKNFKPQTEHQVDLLILLHARSMIRDQDHWCQDVLAMASGQHCLLGALIEASLVHTGKGHIPNHLLANLGQHCPPLMSPIGVNDILGHAAVMKLLEETIADFLPWEGEPTEVMPTLRSPE